MLAAEPDLKLLPTVLVFLRPFGVVFPAQTLAERLFSRSWKEKAHFMISLSLMMRLISEINRELTHTIQSSLVALHVSTRVFERTYFLCE